MLALKTAKRAPFLCTKFVNLQMGPNSAAMLLGTNDGGAPAKVFKWEVGTYEQVQFIHTKSFNLFGATSARYYASDSNMPSPPNLPDKQQIEKYFFRTIAFIWDVTYWLIIWSKRNFEKYVIEHPTVQLYWKKFLAKMEQAKKD